MVNNNKTPFQKGHVIPILEFELESMVFLRPGEVLAEEAT
jgi:hypothetical protein